MKVGPSDSNVNRAQLEQQQSVDSSTSSSSEESTGVTTRWKSSNLDQSRIGSRQTQMSLKLNPSITSKVLNFFGLRSTTGNYSPSTSSSTSSNSIQATKYSSTDSSSSISSSGSFRTASESSYYSTIEESGNESIYESIYDTDPGTGSVSSLSVREAPDPPPRPPIQSQISTGSDDVFFYESTNEPAYIDKGQVEDSEARESSSDQAGALESSYISFEPGGVIYSEFALMPSIDRPIQTRSESEPPPVAPRETAVPKPRRSSSGDSINSSSLFNPEMKLVAQEAVNKVVAGNINNPGGPRVDFIPQVGGISNTGIIAGTDIIVKKNITETEMKVYQFMAQVGEWLKDPLGGPENAPPVLQGLSYPELSVLHSHNQRLLGSLPIPLAMGGEGDSQAVALLNSNKISDGAGGYINLSGFDTTDVKVGAILVSKSELAAHYPQSLEGVGWLRNVVTKRMMPNIRGSVVRHGFEVKPQGDGGGGGFRRLKTALTSTDDILQNRLRTLTPEQLESLERKIEGLQQAANFLPVTFVGSTLKFVIPNPGDMTTMPRVMLDDVGHPMFQNEVSEGGPITPHIYNKYRSNFVAGVGAVKETVTDVITRKTE